MYICRFFVGHLSLKKETSLVYIITFFLMTSCIFYYSIFQYIFVSNKFDNQDIKTYPLHEANLYSDYLHTLKKMNIYTYINHSLSFFISCSRTVCRIKQNETECVITNASFNWELHTRCKNDKSITFVINRGIGELDTLNTTFIAAITWLCKCKQKTDVRYVSRVTLITCYI